jgi:hypothetical protein
VPLQQPPGQDAALHTHWPVLVLHCCPVAQAPQLAPPVPQELADSDAYGSHVPLVPPLQQPLGHVVASQEHAPLVLSQRPLVQETQAAPPVPHWLADSCAYGTHMAPLQQPPGHDAASQEQVPLLALQY